HRAAEPRGLPGERQEGGLDHVLGVLAVAELPAGHAVHHPAVPAHQLREGRLVPGGGGAGQQFALLPGVAEPPPPPPHPRRRRPAPARASPGRIAPPSHRRDTSLPWYCPPGDERHGRRCPDSGRPNPGTVAGGGIESPTAAVRVLSPARRATPGPEAPHPC